MVAPKHWHELEGCGGARDGGGREGLVAVVPGQRGGVGEEDRIIGWVGGRRDIDKAPFGRGCLGAGEGGGGEEEEEEGK